MKLLYRAVRRSGVTILKNGLACLVLSSALAATAQDTPAPSTNPQESKTPADVSTATNNADANKAWRETYKAIQSPLPPKEWADKKPSPKEVMDYYDAFAVKGADKAKDFYTRFPQHPKSADARKAEYNLISMAVEHFGDTNQAARFADLQKQRLDDPSLSQDDRFQIRFQALQQMMQNFPANKDDLLKQAQALQKEFPTHGEPSLLLLEVAPEYDADTAKAIANQIADGPAAEQIKLQALGLLNRLSALGKPVPIQYTALDGRKVDLTAMKGKVVLVDFWATWCGPCVGEVPNVKATYEKLHGRGFEIVGISFDQSKDALTGFVKDKEMPWPQYFDGAGWGNKFGQQFGINSIPTMWLVDKQGNLRDLNARGDLEKKVSNLLAE